MINSELGKIVSDEEKKGSSSMYIRNALKEFLQAYVLYYIYTQKKYNKNLIFTGGTCLRHFFDLPRLSEDLDFDYLEDIDSSILMEDIKEYFEKQLKYRQVKLNLKQRGKQIILKFPVLHALGLADSQESDLLYIKLDLSKNPSSHFNLQITAKSLYGFNFVARHYDISSLMAGKVHAILTRNRLIGDDNRKTVKGRDYFDLLWFIKKPVELNIKRLSEMLGKEMKMNEVKKQLDIKVEELMSKYKNDFKSDMMPLISEIDFINIYVDNYYEEYSRFVNQAFKQKIEDGI